MASELQSELEFIVGKPTEEQPIFLGAVLSRLFKERKVQFTIVGGAAVQFYTQAEYTTADLDAVLSNYNLEDIEAVMGSLGFRRTTTYRHFEHTKFDFVVEFPSSPVAVGSRHIEQVALIQTELGSTRVIRIEDLIMDRIIAGVEWRSQESLRQASLLWFKHKNAIDRDYLIEFAKSEGYADTLKEVMGVKTAKKKKQR